MLGVAAVLFLLHALVASIDGVYFHLLKYKLHTHPDTFQEHVTHTLRAWTMAIGAFLVFTINSGGWLLYGALVLILIDLGIETWDVLIERKSRARFGGLSSAEYLVHAHAIALYAASWALALASRPTEAWAPGSPLVLGAPHPGWVVAIGWAVGVGSVAGGIQHTWYCLPRYREAE